MFNLEQYTVPNKRNSDLVVYTAIFADYDVLTDPKSIDDSIHYVCFTDNASLSSEIWDIILVHDNITHPGLANRWVKTHPHVLFPEFEYSLYIDGNISINRSIRELVDAHMDEHLLAAPIHPVHSNIEKEAEVCIQKSKGDENTINSQLKKYSKMGFSGQTTLTENNILIRKHNNKKIVDLMQYWWNEITVHSSRDQLSFPFVLWKHDVKYDTIGRDKVSAYFTIYPHKPDDIRKYFWPYWVSLIIRSSNGDYFSYPLKFIVYLLRGLNILFTSGLAEFYIKAKEKLLGYL
jgi:hypothetical protein